MSEGKVRSDKGCRARRRDIFRKIEMEWAYWHLFCSVGTKY